MNKVYTPAALFDAYVKRDVQIHNLVRIGDTEFNPPMLIEEIDPNAEETGVLPAGGYSPEVRQAAAEEFGISITAHTAGWMIALVVDGHSHKNVEIEVQIA